MYKQKFLLLVKKGMAAAILVCFSTLESEAQNPCYGENFVATELLAEPTDSIEENLVSEIPLKSAIKILFKSDNGYYFGVTGSKFGYVNAATVRFKDVACRTSLAYHRHSPLNVPGRDVTSEIKRSVESQVNLWQQKNEFEKIADYQKRVNDHSRADKIKEVSASVLDALKTNELVKISNETFVLSAYDAEHESFLVTTPFYGNFAIRVPIATAQLVKNNWNTIKFDGIDFEIRDKRFYISKINFYPDGNKNDIISFDDKQAVTYENVKIAYNFEPIRIENTNQVTNNSSKNKTQALMVGRSDIDADIPKCSERHDDYFAVVIGNENYAKEIKVHYAGDDARAVKDYFVNTLGIPERNIRYLEDATYGQMFAEIDWLNGITKAYDGKVKLFFYYAGHGVPNPESQSAYLLPVDGYASNTGTGIKTEYLYAQLTQNNPQLATVFLDACFSGAAREGMLAGGRGVSVKPKQDLLKGNIVVFSAASGDETAYPYTEKAHGLFTYFLLKKIRESKGALTVGELADYVRQNVNQQSMSQHSRNQTPTLNSGTDLGDTSRSLKIR